MNNLAPEYVAARRVLLDALVALERHLGSLVLVGAQAVYVHTGSADLNVPLMTTDADLAVNTRELADVAEIGGVLRPRQRTTCRAVNKSRGAERANYPGSTANRRRR